MHWTLVPRASDLHVLPRRINLMMARANSTVALLGLLVVLSSCESVTLPLKADDWKHNRKVLFNYIPVGTKLKVAKNKMKKAGFSCKIRRDHRIQATKGEHGPPAIVMPVANYLFCKKRRAI